VFISNLIIDFYSKLFKAKAKEIKEKHLSKSISKGKAERKQAKLSTPSASDLYALQKRN